MTAFRDVDNLQYVDGATSCNKTTTSGCVPGGIPYPRHPKTFEVERVNMTMSGCVPGGNSIVLTLTNHVDVCHLPTDLMTMADNFAEHNIV